MWLSIDCHYLTKNLKVGEFGGGGDCQFLSIAAALNIMRFKDKKDYTCQRLRNMLSDYIKKLSYQEIYTEMNEIRSNPDNWAKTNEMQTFFKKFESNVENNLKLDTEYMKEISNLINATIKEKLNKKSFIKTTKQNKYINKASTNEPKPIKSKQELINSYIKANAIYSTKFADLNETEFLKIFNKEQLDFFKNEMSDTIKVVGWKFQGNQFTLMALSTIFKIGFYIIPPLESEITKLPQNENYDTNIILNYNGGNHYQLVVKSKNNKYYSNFSNRDDINKCNIKIREIKKIKNIEKLKVLSTQTHIQESANIAYKKYIKNAQIRDETILTFPKNVDQEVKKVFIEEISQPNKITLYFERDPIILNGELAEPNNIQNIKEVTLKILIKKYTDLLNSFIKYMNLTNDEDNEYNDIYNVTQCFESLLKYIENKTNYDIDKCTFKDTDKKLIFTRGIIDYLNKLDKLFKTGKIDQQYLDDIPKNINMIIGVMYYIIEQIYTLRKDIDEDVFNYIVVPIIPKYIAILNEPKYIAILNEPKYIAIPDKPKYIAIPTSPKFIAIPDKPKYIAIPISE